MKGTSIFRQFASWGSPLHISVDGFRRFPSVCRSPDKLPWVAAMAHLVFHVSSRVTICSPHFEITKDWAVSQLLGVASSETSSEDVAEFP